jgi:hypothetical protein
MAGRMKERGDVYPGSETREREEQYGGEVMKGQKNLGKMSGVLSSGPKSLLYSFEGYTTLYAKNAITGCSYRYIIPLKMYWLLTGKTTDTNSS